MSSRVETRRSDATSSFETARDGRLLHKLNAFVTAECKSEAGAGLDGDVMIPGNKP